MSEWKQVSQDRPCEVCGKPDWCQFTENAIQCMRDSNHPRHGRGSEKIDASGNAYWAWSLQEKSFNSSPEPTIEPSTKRGSAETLNRVYSAFLKRNCLDFNHMRALVRRGLTMAEIEELKKRGYGTQQDKGRSGVVRAMLSNGISEADIAQTPGFYVVEHEGSRYWTTSRLVGMLIPVRNSAGQIVSLKVRLDNPDHSGKYKAFSSLGKKRKGSGPGSPVHFPQFDGDTSTVRVTEGQIKADIATIKTGILTIGLAGVGGWRSAAVAALAVGAQSVLVSYDADHRTNPQVRRSLVGLLQSLNENELKVRLETWT